MKTKLPFLLLAAFALPALGAGTWTTSSWNSGFTAATNNILRGKLPDPASGLSTSEGSKSFAALTDGDAGTNDKSKTTCLADNASLTYSLGAAYTVNEVRIYATWSDGNRNTVSVSSITAETQGGQTVTLSPNAISYHDSSNCTYVSLKMADGSALCGDVVKVVFNLGTQDHGYVGYSEFEVVVAESIDLNLSKVIEIPSGESVTTNLTPADLSIWGPNGGNLTIAGSGTVVTQNVPDVTTMAGVNFGSYWPWIEGTVTVENGATLKSNTQLFRGPGVVNNSQNGFIRKLVVQSGASAVFSPSSGDANIVGLENSGYQNAWVVVTGTNSTLTLPANVYLGNRGDYAGHGGGMDVLDGGHVEMGTFYVGYHSGTLRLNVDGGSLRATDGIYGFKNGSRWTGATILFKDCVVETPFYKMAYPHGNGASTVTFDGAVFRAIGIPPTKFIDASPTGDERCPHYVTGDGLIVDAPIGASLKVSAMLQGTGGFTKRGDGAVTLSGANTYTGATVVEEGTLNITGALAGGLSVSSGASCAVSLAVAPSAGALSVAGTATFSMPFSATSLALPAGGTIAVTGLGSNVGAVSDYAGDFVVSLPAGVSDWPQSTPVVSSSTDAFLEKVAAALNASETVPAGCAFQVRNGSVVLVESGVVNGTIEWDGGASDALWSTPGNWDINRRIYSGDTLVVAAGGVSTNDLGAIVVESAAFSAGTAAHTVGASGASDALRVNESISNLSESVQTFDLPVSIGESTFAVHATGDLVFRQGLAATAGVTPVVTKTGAGTLAIDGATWGGALDLQEGTVVLDGQTSGAAILSSVAGGVRVDGTLDAGGAAVTLGESSPRILGDNAVLANGIFTYVPRSGYNYLDLDEDQVLTLTDNATFATTSAIFENETGNRRGVRVLDGSSLVFDNNGNGFISSKDGGTGGFLHASGGSTIVLPRGRTYIAWPYWAGRNGRIDVLDGSFIAGGSVEFAWRAGRADFTLTNSAASFTDGLYLDANNNIDYSHSHMHVSGSVVTAGVWRVGNAIGNVNVGSELVFDAATLATFKDDTDAEPWFKCTKPDCDQIRILAGGLAVDTTNTVTLAAPLVGAGGLTKLGSGTLTVASTNSYAGATVVSNGTLRLTGRVAGPIAVAPGATLALPIPAAGEEAPVVPSIVVEPGAALEAIVPGLPQGVACVDVLRTTGAISLATQAGDSAHKRFFAGPSKGGMALRYGNPPGMTIIIR